MHTAKRIEEGKLRTVSCLSLSFDTFNDSFIHVSHSVQKEKEKKNKFAIFQIVSKEKQISVSKWILND